MSEYFRVIYQLNVPGTSSPEFRNNFETIAGFMARDGSFGTWTELKNVKNIGYIKSEYGAFVEYADRETNTVALKFPADNFDFEYGHITLLLNTIAGDILGIAGIEQAKVIHIDYPPSWLAKFGGPTCGVKGLRELLKVPVRPLVAFSIKPRVGLDKDQIAEIARQAASGGADIIEDDERMLNPSYCPIEERVKAVKEALAKIKPQTSKTIYSVNISCRPDKVIELVQKVLAAGADALKVDVLATGFPALAQVADYTRGIKHPVPIFVYPALFRVFEHSIRREVLLELSRYMGADILYAGAPKTTGRMDVVQSILTLRYYHDLLLRPIENPRTIHRTMPSVSTNIHPGNINYLLKAIGNNDFAYFIGGGIAGNPLGVEKGTALIMKVLDKAVNNSSFGHEDFRKTLTEEERRAMEEIGWDYIDWNTQKEQIPDLKILLREDQTR